MNSLKDSNLNCVVICGLPGSGKTTFAQNLMDCFWHDSRVILWDDFDRSNNIPNFSDNLEMLIVTTPYYAQDSAHSIEKYLRKCLNSLNKIIEFTYFFFENNPENCWNNAKHRPNKSVEKFIHIQSSLYVVPSTHVPIPVKAYEI